MGIEAHADVRAYFQEKVSRVLSERGHPDHALIEFYLVDLLAKYAANPLLDLETPLVHLLMEAQEAEGVAQLQRFRALGDLALVVSGFFNDHLDYRGVNRGYAMTMGEGAYAHASTLTRCLASQNKHDWAGVFGTLAQRFKAYADVLDEVREHTELRTPQDIVRLYERWRRTESPVLIQRLEEEGVFPQALAQGKRALN